MIRLEDQLREIKSELNAAQAQYESAQQNVSAKSGLPRIRGKLGKNKIFSRSGDFEKMSGNFGHLTNVRKFCDDN